MKTAEKEAPVVKKPTVAQNSQIAEQLLKKKELIADMEKAKAAPVVSKSAPKGDLVDSNETAQDKLLALKTKVSTRTPKPKSEGGEKTKRVRSESMENKALRLRKEGADMETITAEFVAAYKLKGKTDMEFINPRITIYLGIADKALGKKVVKEGKKELPVEEPTKPTAKADLKKKTDASQTAPKKSGK